ncbi:MAG: dockerin type I domain-containing protein [Phycisphaerales bacterium]
MRWRTSISTVSRRFGVTVAAILISPPAWAADLPPHGPLRILITSDGVNPHGLPPELLVGPGDISEALSNPKTGLNIDEAPDSIVEIPTNQIELATEALSVSRCDPASYDVLIYFSHRQPNNGTAEDNAARQAAFVAAVESFLEVGGGVVVFHHGLFPGAGKAGILEVLGGFGQSISWNTKEGQNVINVAPGHFVTTNSIEYPDMVEYADPKNGIPLELYSFFNNTPDERYTFTRINDTADDVEILFASNYLETQPTHILGFTHQRPTWAGIVIWYQPGEYQPNALDDLDGNNFQILANEIVFAAEAGSGSGSADLNGDGFVNSIDLTILLVSWGPCDDPPERCPADIDGDGQVGASDLLILLTQWG